MAEEFLQGGVCGWNSPRYLFSSSPCSLPSNDIGSFGWPSHAHALTTEMKSVGSSDESDGSSSVLVQDVQNSDGSKSTPGVDLSSTSAAPDGWNQDLLCDSGRSEENYSDFLLDSRMNYRPQMNKDWNSKNFSEDSSINTLNQSFGGEQQQRINSVSNSGSDSYSYASSLLQTLFDTDSQPQQSLLHHQTPTSYSSSAAVANYPQLNSNGFLPLPKQQTSANRVWNSTPASFSNVRPTFLPPPPQFLPSALSNHKPNIQSIGDHKQHEHGKDLATVVKKVGNEPALKRPRIETPSPLPTFKVRKEKLGDRITALQQLVSPFGKTDTASVLHEAIEYIRFLHDQVNALSTPYLKHGSPPVQRQQGTDNSKDKEGLTKDLKTRGLCLVPISSTFPVAAETTTDFWTPTFGGSFR